MKDTNLGMILATVIAAPVVMVCCGGGAGLISGAIAMAGVWFIGANALESLLIAVLIGIGVLTYRSYSKRENHKTEEG